MTESVRNDELKAMPSLGQGRIAQLTDARDDLDMSDADLQSNFEFALLQVRTDTRSRIDVALARLAAGEDARRVNDKGKSAPRRGRFTVPDAVGS